MQKEKGDSKSKEQLILAVIQQLKDGRVEAGSLDKETRQRCVEVFVLEGYSVPQMAQILVKCEKTIRRDIAEIREHNTLTPGIELAKKLIGEMVTYSRVHRSHLMRMARGQNTSTSEKAQAEYFAHRVTMDMIDKLQRLGYLPQATQSFEHYIKTDDERSFVELRSQIIEIEKISEEAGELTPEMSRELEELKKRIDKAEIATKVIGISNKQKKEAKDVK